MKAVILAAGKGTRLAPLTLHTPKSLVSVAGKAILEHIIMSLPQAVSEVIIIVQHMADQIEAHIGTTYADKKITYVRQGEMSGTYGALRSARVHLTESFLVMNGDDIHHKEDIATLLSRPRSCTTQTIVRAGYRSVIANEQGYFSDFVIPPQEQSAISTFTGLYHLDPDFFLLEPVQMESGEYSIPDTLFKHTTTYALSVIPVSRSILINTLEELEQAEHLLSS